MQLRISDSCCPFTAHLSLLSGKNKEFLGLTCGLHPACKFHFKCLSSSDYAGKGVVGEHNLIVEQEFKTCYC